MDTLQNTDLRYLTVQIPAWAPGPHPTSEYKDAERVALVDAESSQA